MENMSRVSYANLKAFRHYDTLFGEDLGREECKIERDFDKNRIAVNCEFTTNPDEERLLRSYHLHFAKLSKDNIQSKFSVSLKMIHAITVNGTARQPITIVFKKIGKGEMVSSKVWLEVGKVTNISYCDEPLEWVAIYFNRKSDGFTVLASRIEMEIAAY